jgi:hypothetical protein
VWNWLQFAAREKLCTRVDARLLRAISTPRIQQQASELVELSLRALDDLRQLDESLYERFVSTRNAPEDSEAAKQRMRKLWDDTFRGLRELLVFTKATLAEPANKQDKRASTESADAFDFGDFSEPAAAEPEKLDLGGADFGELLEGLGDDGERSEAERWSVVLEKLSSIEYGLRSQLQEASTRLDVAVESGELNQVLGLLDDTQSSTSEGVHAVVSAIYEEFLPDTNPATVVPGYLTSLGRALLVRRGLADIATKLTTHNDILQSDKTGEHAAALAAIRQWMRSFVSSVVCRAMRAADRFQMVEFERELSEQPPSVARLTSEGLVKYIDSLASINQREVLVIHDTRTLEEMRDSLANARQLMDLSPATAREMMDRAYQAAQRLRGRHPATDALIIQLERFAPTSSSPGESVKFLERLEAVMSASG